jgi:hypothetical protein
LKDLSYLCVSIAFEGQNLTFIRDFLKQAEADGKKDAAGKEKAAH